MTNPLYVKAIQVWGQQAQIDMCIEECAELIKALQKLKRKNFIVDYNDVCEEIADVKIMIEQMSVVFDDRIIAQLYMNKLEHLKNLLEE